MVEIGGRPILWHIMKIYEKYGFVEFVILLGYKGHLIKDYFCSYAMRQNDLLVDLTDGSITQLGNANESWKVSLIDTGLHTMTGGRIRQARDLVGGSRFLLTYGDGVADIDIARLVEHHDEKAKLITMTVAQPDGRFGACTIDSNDSILEFREKPKGDGSWVNAGFFVCEPEVMDFIEDDEKTIFEKQPLERLAGENQCAAYKHQGFWMPMDTIRDKNLLNDLYKNGNAPWITW